MQGKKTYLLILIYGLAVGAVLSAFPGFLFLPDYKMNSFTPAENEIVRWSYLLVGVSSSLMSAASAIIWFVASFKTGFFKKPTIVELIVTIAIVVFWILLVMDGAWGAFWRLHTITVF
jgi:hypothetical protein